MVPTLDKHFRIHGFEAFLYHISPTSERFIRWIQYHQYNATVCDLAIQPPIWRHYRRHPHPRHVLLEWMLPLSFSIELQTVDQKTMENTLGKNQNSRHIHLRWWGRLSWKWRKRCLTGSYILQCYGKDSAVNMTVNNKDLFAPIWVSTYQLVDLLYHW